MSVQSKYATSSKPETPRNLAKRLFDAAKRDKSRTVEQMVNLAANQRGLRDYLIRLGATTLVGEVVVTDRRAVLDRLPDDLPYTPRTYSASASNVVEAPVRGAASQRRLREATRGATLMALLDFPLPTPGNKLLRNADAREVWAASAHYQGSAKNALRHSAWLSAVAAKLPKGKTVADVFDNRALNTLFNSVAA